MLPLARERKFSASEPKKLLTATGPVFTARRIPRPKDEFKACRRRCHLEIRESEIFGLLGPSGAGKTTTQRVLTRQQRKFTGRVRVLGKPLTDWGPEYFEEIGVGFELPIHYLKFTAIENLEFFASLYTKKSRDPRGDKGGFEFS